MSLKNIKKLQTERGFTIVELLIVIVVIAILAAITIVAYNGVTARANTTSAKAAASTFAKKAEAYQADSTANRYPDAAADLTGAASTTSYNLTGVTANYSQTAITTAPASNNVIRVNKCGIAAGSTSLAAITEAAASPNTIAGLRIYYWDYTAGAEATPVDVGNVANCATAA